MDSLWESKIKQTLGKGENLISELPLHNIQMSPLWTKDHKAYKDTEEYGLFTTTKKIETFPKEIQTLDSLYEGF